MKKVSYNILKLCPDVFRGEVVNIGIVAEWKNELRYILVKDKRKVRLLSSTFSVFDIESYLFSANIIYRTYKNINVLRELIPNSQISMEDSGYFILEYDSEELFKDKLNELYLKWVELPRKKHPKTTYDKKLSQTVKDFFNNQGLLSSNPNDLYSHKIISNYPLSESKGLKADLLLKNGEYHLTEIINFSKKNDFTLNLQRAALKTVTIEEAKTVLNSRVNAFLIYDLSADDEKKFTPHLNLLEERATLVNYRSTQDITSYYKYIIDKTDNPQLPNLHP
ncbi:MULTISPECIES: DUF3037 domain-containing protein [Eikenella]|uniref:DUF3037 domain-containing protein n=1 Tax=Eikenella exigua TaxID=2528037 RepID=A0AAX1F947_9NEIS|nr:MULTISPECIES: DUF3037 domain-containing protein [Eikenella]OAM28488.1 hypothetical protein A7P94_00120 [Eikenella sp. NML01-A-086]OAM41384.1 hypothetical protein A7Q02_08845 [Eikenella sp. NML97-A-109]QED92288.1 DUF3037 domain-containing protein [Eikenella exigua]